MAGPSRRLTCSIEQPGPSVIEGELTRRGMVVGAVGAGIVVNADGEAHGYPGLYVVDGAAVPTALGVNPSLTIAALAERAAVRLVRRLGKMPVAPPVSNPYVRRRRHETGAGLR